MTSVQKHDRKRQSNDILAERNMMTSYLVNSVYILYFASIFKSIKLEKYGLSCWFFLIT